LIACSDIAASHAGRGAGNAGRAEPAAFGYSSMMRRRIRLGAALLATGALAAPAAANSGGGGGDYDPWEGIDRDGRIEKVELPSDLPNPDRWRYIPEGRIKPGNVFQRFLISSFIAPFFFHDSDVGFGMGVAVTDIDFRQQRRQEFAGVFLSYTTEGQQRYTGVWRRWLHHREHPDGGVLQEERSFVTANVGYEKSLTKRFFGYGSHTDEDDESSYTDQSAFGGVGFDLALPEPGSDWVVSAGLRGEWHALGAGKVGGEPDTDDAFPGIFDAAEHHSLGWVELGARYDTRDSQRQPYRGFAVGAAVDAALAQTGGDVGAIFSLYGTQVFPLPPLFHDGGDEDEENPPTDTFAVQLDTRAMAGDLPFFAVPSLGGRQYLRGFIAGRFRDRALWHASAEYRFWVLARGFAVPFAKTFRVERVGLALFADVGSVSGDWPGLFDAQVQASYGVGFRVALERAAPFRIDVGFSEDGVEVTAGFGLPF